jgi:hypothetical protein
MIQTAFNSVSGFDYGSDTPKSYKDVLNHNNKTGLWASMQNDFRDIEKMVFGKLF